MDSTKIKGGLYINDSGPITGVTSSGTIGTNPYALVTESVVNSYVSSNFLSANTSVSIPSGQLYSIQINSGGTLYGDSGFTYNPSFGVSSKRSGALYNEIFGKNAGNTIMTGQYNTILGEDSGRILQAGNNNTFIGYRSGYFLTGSTTSFASYNVYIGAYAGYSNTLGTNAVYIGYQAGYTNTTSDSVCIGYKAGYLVNTSNNVLIGSEAGAALTSGIASTMIGHQAGKATTGSRNTFLGYLAGNSNIGGANNVYIGHGSAQNKTAGDDNVIIGYGTSSVASATGTRNIIIGTDAGKSNKGGNNIMFGYRSGYSNNGDDNVFIGRDSGYNNLSGNSNVFIGYGSGNSNTKGINNVYVGVNAGYSATGSTNVFIGYYAGFLEKGNNRLYINNANADQYASLIYGEFDNKILRINGQLQLSGNTSIKSQAGNLLFTDTTGTYALSAMTGGGNVDTSVLVTTGTTQTITGLKTFNSVIYGPGSTAAGTAFMKLTSGATLTATEKGAVEFTGFQLNYTDWSGTTGFRQTVVPSAYAGMYLASGTFSHSDGSSTPNVIGSSSLSYNGSPKYITTSNTSGIHTIQPGGKGIYLITWSLKADSTTYDVTIRLNGASGTIYGKSSGNGSTDNFSGSHITELNPFNTIGMYTQGAGSTTTIYSYSLSLCRIGV